MLVSIIILLLISMNAQIARITGLTISRLRPIHTIVLMFVNKHELIGVQVQNSVIMSTLGIKKK